MENRVCAEIGREVKTAIAWLKCDKATGIDGITSKMLKKNYGDAVVG